MTDSEQALLASQRPRADRPLTDTDAKLMFMELANALWLDKPITRNECESLVQEVLFVIEQHRENSTRIATEVARWKAEVPLDFSARFAELTGEIDQITQHDPLVKERLDKHLDSLYAQYKRLSAELRSLYHPSRFDITYSYAGSLQVRSPLQILQVNENDDGRVNLLINHRPIP